MLHTMYAQAVPFSNHIIHNSPPIYRQQTTKLSPKPPPLLFNWTSFSAFQSTTCSSTSGRRWAVIRCGGSQDNRELRQDDEFDDGFYMRRCVELAKKAIGRTSPNPMVGCVIVKDGKIVGEGFHPKAGLPHAEVFALRDAGDLAENGTAYVSLEPCNHYGRTPPCTEALIKAKVRRLVVGMVDPNPIVASTGVKKLQDAGIEVTVGVEEEMCTRLNEAYIHYMLTQKPYVTLRYSMSLDGRIMNQCGEEAVECGGYYSKLLQEYDAIVLSSTALAAKSSLPFSREPDANQPLKILLSRNPNPLVQIPALENDIASKLTIISEKDVSLESHTVQEGIETLCLDRISLPDILEYCKNQGLCSVLLDLVGDYVDFEGIIKEGFELNLIQKAVVEVLPLVGHGQERVLKHMDLRVQAKKMTSCLSGKSVLLEGYF